MTSLLELLELLDRYSKTPSSFKSNSVYAKPLLVALSKTLFEFNVLKVTDKDVISESNPSNSLFQRFCGNLVACLNNLVGLKLINKMKPFKNKV